MESEGDGWRVKHSQTGLEVQVPREQTVSRGSKSLLGIHWEKELLSQEFWWEKSHLARCIGDHGSEGRLVF